jgi:alkylation response protein AidB-like acyl-CoA dehydrogenase
MADGGGPGPGAWRYAQASTVASGTIEMQLGALETAVAEHLRVRQQFNQALADLQTIRFTMADVTVSLRGFEQLSKATTWRLGRGDERERLADALALRLHAVDVAVATLRVAHQFYGALGFCEETNLSVLDRHLQPTLRYPVSAERIAQALVPFIRGRALTAKIA